MTRQTALIADDDAASRTALVTFFTYLGFESRGFASAEALSDAAVRSAPTLVITDQHMGGMLGIDGLRTMREGGAKCPAIIVSAFPDVALTRDLARMPLCELVEKPIDFRLLEASVLRLVRRPIPG